MNPLLVEVDHIVVPTDSLEETARAVRDDLGLVVVAGGLHDGVGTRNLIVPLGDGYLEIVAIVDEELAAGTPFGRLIRSRVGNQAPCGALWASPVSDSFQPPESLSAQVLRREGVCVELFGVDEVVDSPHLPFLIRRGDAQSRPGALAPSAHPDGGSTPRPAGIAAMTLQLPVSARGRYLGEVLEGVAPGLTAIVQKPSDGVERGGGVVEFDLRWSDGTATRVDPSTMSRR
jgi:hypothetical protein